MPIFFLGVDLIVFPAFFLNNFKPHVIWLGVNEKVQNTGEPMPNFFLGVDLIVFPAFFFIILSPVLLGLG